MPAPTVPNATHSHGVTFSYWNTGAYTLLGGFKNIKRGPTKVTASQVKTLDAAGAAVLKVPGMLDEGAISGTLVFRSANAALVRSWLRTMIGFQLQAPDGTTPSTGTTWTGTAMVSELGEEFPEDDIISQDVTFDISGPVVQTPAS